MSLKRSRASALLLGLLAGTLLAPRAGAFIERLYSLQEVMDASKVIVTAEIESVDPEHRTAIARVTGTLKGQCPYPQIRMNLGVGQSWFPEGLLAHLRVGAPVVFFYTYEHQDTEANGGAINIAGEQLAALGHVDGLWFQLFGTRGQEAAKTWWNLSHLEVHMQRTYQGGTAELIQIVRDVLAGRRQAPPPNPDLPDLTREAVLGRATPAAPVATPAPERVPTATPLAAAAVAREGLAPGLLAEIFSGREFDAARRRAARVDPAVDFDWGDGPPGAGLEADGFCVRWRGYLEVPAAGAWRLETESDDGVRLFLGERLVVENWTDHAPTLDGSWATLAAGLHPVRIEFYENGGGALCRLRWRRPDEAESRPVPAARLFHERAAAEALLAAAAKARPPPPPRPTPVQEPLLSWVFGGDARALAPAAGALLTADAPAEGWALESSGPVSFEPGGVRVADGARLVSERAGRALAERFMRTGQFTLAAIVTPADAAHADAARIVGLSVGGGQRNVSLCQEGERWVVRLRTPAAGANGDDLHLRLGRVEPRRTPVAIVFDGREMRFFLDGKLVHAEARMNGDLEGWDIAFPLILANELRDQRDWAGLIERVAFYERALAEAELAELSRAEPPAPAASPADFFPPSEPAAGAAEDKFAPARPTAAPPSPTALVPVVIRPLEAPARPPAAAAPRATRPPAAFPWAAVLAAGAGLLLVSLALSGLILLRCRKNRE